MATAARPLNEGVAPSHAGEPLSRVKLGADALLPMLTDALSARPVPMPPLIAKVRVAALAIVLQERLLLPALAYAVHPLAAVEPDALVLRDGSVLPTPERFGGAVRVAAGVCGVGTGIDRRVAAAFAAGSGRLALALDLIGTHALFRLSNHARALIYEEAQKDGLAIGAPLEPGMANFSLRGQGLLLRLAETEALGFFVTGSGAAGPGRVLTFAIPIGRNMPPWRPTDRCRQCPSLEACRRMGMAVDD